MARSAGDPYVESAALWQVGACLAVRGELDDAERTLEEAVSLERKLGNVRSLGLWLKTLAGVAIMRDDRAQARRLLNESLAIHRSLDDAYGVLQSLSRLASVALDAGDADTAHALVTEALVIGVPAIPSRDSPTRSRSRQGSPPRTDSRGSPSGCTPAQRCSGSVWAGTNSTSDGPTSRRTSTISTHAPARRCSRNSGSAAAR